jgi:aerobic-type carbon monoxide dehydrogenase small subunit (CoxS/CutS family)
MTAPQFADHLDLRLRVNGVDRRLDGRRVNGCLVLAAAAGGRGVVTVEGWRHRR